MTGVFIRRELPEYIMVNIIPYVGEPEGEKLDADVPSTEPKRRRRSKQPAGNEHDAGAVHSTDGTMDDTNVDGNQDSES